MQLQDAVDKGLWGQRVVGKLWPDIYLSNNGHLLDKAGIDGFYGTRPIQIKTDDTITETGNLYLEMWEKTIGNEHQDWRCSMSKAEIYIFVTHHEAVMVETDELAKAAKGKPIRQIKETSIGVLIPKTEIQILEAKRIKE
jgi:hypothetical protein